MKTLMTVVRLALVVGGACGALIGAWAFVDPDTFPALGQLGDWARWRAAVVFLFSLAALGFGTGVLRHRQLPRRR